MRSMKYCRAHGAVALPEFLAALSLLVAEDVLAPFGHFCSRVLIARHF